MDANTGNVDTDALMKERFATLPKVVQDAITSADVEKRMRDLAESHKLHVDQWQILENNVMVTLLGFQPVAELREHLKKDLGVTDEVASVLATSVSELVFKPIRSEMEQNLDHPTAIQEAESALEAVRKQEMSAAAPPVVPPPAQASAAGAPPVPAPVSDIPAPTAAPAAATSIPAVAPATPPSPAPVEKVVRAQVAQTYAGTASHERKSIEGDPYREQLS